jgi:cell wall-associated NlpC family hydrolase
MLILRKAVIAILFCGIGLSAASAQEDLSPPVHTKTTKRKHESKSERALTSDERLAVLASALDSKIPRLPEYDCSHLVHAIYERAGFPYPYANSDDLYDGVEGFERVSQPQLGDLVVWRGHAGIVVRPSRHVFFSFLHAGPGIDDYASRYWRGRGQPRFYHYLKNSSCAGCTLARGRAE